jgi:nitroimidazol reductase NimA-like FMN-containing flavoprotein (pyridoxamine 5'-phosphate oxidase superfamily)
MAMRREDRAVRDSTVISQILDNCLVGRLGLSDDDQPYVVPLHFAHRLGPDGQVTVYMHGAPQGLKTDIVARNPRACFEADRHLGLVETATLCQFGAKYESVIGRGIVQIVANDDAKRAVFDLIAAKYAPSGVGSLAGQALGFVTVLALPLDQVSAKRRTAD